MRKPKQPNTLGFYGYKKNAHSVTNRQVKHTASARNTKPLHVLMQTSTYTRKRFDNAQHYQQF